MRESRLSGSVEGVMSDHDSYSDFESLRKCCSEFLFFDALPFLFWNQSIERVNHQFDGFQIFTVSAGDFRMRMIVAQRLAKLKNGSRRAGQLFDALVDGAFVDGNVFAQRDQNVAQQNGDTRNRLAIDFAQLLFVVGGAQKMVAQFLQRGSQFVLHLRAMQIHRHFEASDGVVAKKNAMHLADVQQLDGKDIGGMN